MIAKANKKLQLALKRLDKAGGDIAVRNARKDVLAALRALRKAVDAEKPHPRRKGKKPRKPRTRQQQMRDLERNGWVNVLGRSALIGMLLKAGVRTRSVGHQPFAPEWAIRILTEVGATALRKAKRSVRERKAMLAEIELSR